MKQKEIETGKDYIVGPSSRLWEGPVGRDIDYIPFRLMRVRILDARPHKTSSWSSRPDKAPELVEEGKKPDRRFNTVGALAVGVKQDGTPGDRPFVVKPQDVRMEFDAWRTEYKQRHEQAIENRERARKAQAEKEERDRIARDERAKRIRGLNGVLYGTGVEAKEIGTSIVLHGAPDDLLKLAQRAVGQEVTV